MGTLNGRIPTLRSSYISVRLLEEYESKAPIQFRYSNMHSQSLWSKKVAFIFSIEGLHRRDLFFIRGVEPPCKVGVMAQPVSQPANQPVGEHCRPERLLISNVVKNTFQTHCQRILMRSRMLANANLHGCVTTRKNRTCATALGVAEMSWNKCFESTSTNHIKCSKTQAKINFTIWRSRFPLFFTHKTKPQQQKVTTEINFTICFWPFPMVFHTQKNKS